MTNKNEWCVDTLRFCDGAQACKIKCPYSREAPKQRGGAREGAGRPATGQGKRMELYCRPDIFERLTDHALALDTSKSALVMQILDDYFAKVTIKKS